MRLGAKAGRPRAPLSPNRVRFLQVLCQKLKKRAREGPWGSASQLFAPFPSPAPSPLLFSPCALPAPAASPAARRCPRTHTPSRCCNAALVHIQKTTTASACVCAWARGFGWRGVVGGRGGGRVRTHSERRANPRDTHKRSHPSLSPARPPHITKTTTTTTAPAAHRAAARGYPRRGSLEPVDVYAAAARRAGRRHAAGRVLL